MTALQLIAEGSSKLASVPSGGGGGAAAAGGGAAAAGGAAPEAAKEEAKEEGKDSFLPTPSLQTDTALTVRQKRRSPTRTWALVSSTKNLELETKKQNHCTQRGKVRSIILAACGQSWRRCLHLHYLGPGAGVIGFGGNCQHGCAMGSRQVQ